MTIQTLQSFLAWSLVVHFSVLLLWVWMMKYANEYVYRIHTYWIPISKDSFNVMHYGGIGLYKLLIFIFNLTPYIALMLID